MEFCEEKSIHCLITQDVRDCSTLQTEEEIKILKDCSEKTCDKKGQGNCLLRKK